MAHAITLPPAWLAVIGAVAMASMGVMSRNAEVDAAVITFYRLGLGTLFIGLLLAYQRKSWQRPHALTLLGGGLLAGFIVFYVEAMNYTTMANAILVVYLAPVVAAIAGHWFWQERINRWQSGCIGLALFGFAMVMEFNLAVSATDAKGLGFASLAMLAYAGFMLVNRHNPDPMPAAQTAFWQLLAGALVMLALAGPVHIVVPTDKIGWMVATGLLPGFLGIVLSVLALQRLPTATFGTLAYSEPVAVVIFGWWLFAEQLSWLQMAGCSVIIAAGIAQAALAPKVSPTTASSPDTCSPSPLQ